MSDIADEKKEQPLQLDEKQEEKEVQKKKYARRYGSRSEVFDSETAEMTRGGLRKADLILSRTGKIVSKRKSESAKKIYDEYGFNKRVAPPKKTKKKKRGKKKRSPKK